MATFRQLVREAAVELAAAGIEAARQEAEWLLAGVFFAGNRLRLHLAGGEAAPPTGLALWRALLGRRLAGEPLQYLLCSAEFHGLPLAVGPGVLIPRPETEGLVALAREHYPGHGAVCDLCTGCGAVALALAAELPPAAQVWGVDLSPAALHYARRNAAALGLASTVFLEGDLLGPVPPTVRFALVTANPPYIDSAACAQLPAEVRAFEPRRALDGGPDGLDLVRRLAADVPARLLAGGWFLCEIGHDQGEPARNLLRAAGFLDVEVSRDAFGRDRHLAGRLAFA
jgi:release factor glutamine methyltransferase